MSVCLNPLLGQIWLSFASFRVEIGLLSVSVTWSLSVIVVVLNFGFEAAAAASLYSSSWSVAQIHILYFHACFKQLVNDTANANANANTTRYLDTFSDWCLNGFNCVIFNTELLFWKSKDSVLFWYKCLLLFFLGIHTWFKHSWLNYQSMLELATLQYILD